MCFSFYNFRKLWVWYCRDEVMFEPIEQLMRFFIAVIIFWSWRLAFYLLKYSTTQKWSNETNFLFHSFECILTATINVFCTPYIVYVPCKMAVFYVYSIVNWLLCGIVSCLYLTILTIAKFIYSSYWTTNNVIYNRLLLTTKLGAPHLRFNPFQFYDLHRTKQILTNHLINSK